MISERERELERQVAKLERINAALIERVESSNLPRIAPYAAFEHAALLAEQVRERTRALNQTLDELRASNRLLGEARKRAEQANQYLVDAIESITDAFVLFGADQRIQHFNSRFAEFWRPAGIEIRAGMSLEELRRLALTSGLVVKEQLKQREGRTVYQLHDGRWVQVNQRPICGGGRVFLYVDITELKRHEHAQREHALAQKSRLLQATLDSLSQGVAVITRGGQLEMHNQRFSQLTGLDGLTLPVALASLEATSELLDPADMQAILPACERRLSDGRVVEVRGHPMPGGGQVLTYTDITERIRQAEALAERERWIRTITDQVPAMIAYLNRELCYVFTNRVYEEWYGWPHDLPLGSSLGDLHSAEHCARLMPYLQRVLAGERISFELPEQNVAGEQRVLLRAYVPHRDSDGSVIGFFVLVRDITEQRRTAEALHHAYQNLEQRVRERTAELTRVNAQLRGEIDERLAAECQLREAKTEAEAANLSKTKFLAAVSHDLLQPLNAARLFVGALVEQEMSATNLELIQQVGHSLKDVETLLGTLVDISKLDAGVITPEVAPFAIRDLLDGLAREYRQVAASEGLAFHYVPSSAIVRSDISLMARVIRNLLSNAVRYTPGGHLLLGCRRRRKGLEIQVLDTGCGIPAEERELIFQEFRRLQTASARDRGLGLGLSIVDKISRMLHQPVRVSSQIDRGTLFGVLLPYAQQLPADQPRPVVVSGVGRELAGRCLWVVDNDPAICLAMRHLLERWGCNVIVAESETRLSQLACLAEEGADALIVDYHLDHECNGLDLAERINAMRKRPLPVLVITADHSRELRQQVRSLGFQLLNKPVKPLRLRTTLQQLVADAPLEATAGELQGLRR